MAFRLAEAFVELKARGEKELHKSLEKTKEKVKEVGPAANQAEKSIEKSAQDAAKGVDKASTAMVKSLQKPIDKLAQLEAEMKQKFSALNQRADALRTGTGQQSGGMGNLLSSTNRMFGRFGGVGSVAAAGGLVGIAAAVGHRANDLAGGEDSKILGPQISREVRDTINGMKAAGKAVVDTLAEVGQGFVDGLVGFTYLAGNAVTLGGLSRYSESKRIEAIRERNNAEGLARGRQFVKDVEAIDPYRPFREADKRGRLDNIFKTGGIEGLEREAGSIRDNMHTADDAKELLAVNERIAVEKERAAKAGEQSAIAAEREAAAFRHAGQMATWAPGRQLAIAEEAWRTGRPEASIDAEMKFNLGPDAVALMEARMKGLDKLNEARRTAGGVNAFADKAEDRAAAMIEEGDATKKLRREYEQLAAAVAALPAGAGKDAAQATLAEAKMNVVAAEALDAEKRQNEERKRIASDALRNKAKGEADAIRQRFADLEFDLGNKPRPTTSFQTVGAPDFAKLIQADVFAKEDEQRRAEEAKARHEEIKKLQEEQRDELKAVNANLEKGLKAVAG